MSATNKGAPIISGDVHPDAPEMYRLHVVNRWTQYKIADHFGVSQQRVSQIIAAYRKALPPIDYEAARRSSLELYTDVQRRAYDLAEREGAPVTAGKDGSLVYDPDSHEVVRDYSGRVAALRLALESDKELRKLLGLDAAQKVESTSVVRYEIAGVDPETLR